MKKMYDMTQKHCAICIHSCLTECYVHIARRRMELPYCNKFKMVIHDLEHTKDCKYYIPVIDEEFYMVET